MMIDLARNTAVKECPAREKLVAYSLGAVGKSDIPQIAAHLEHCTACLQTLSEIDDRGDPLVTSLARVRDGGSITGVIDEQRILHRLAGLGGGFSTRPERIAPPKQVGPYEILEPLAEGGMGAVYTARHVHLGKIVALKLLSSERVADAMSVARFIQEMKALGQLSHPNIVQAHDAGVETVPFLAMEFLEGMDLARLVKERGPLSVAQACECIRQAALALQYASTCGLVHRDIKPANLMLTPDGCLKVLDLGLARFGADLPHDTDGPIRDDAITSEGAVLGTIDYIAPEQLMDSRSVDSRADLYSLGCTLFYLLTGVPPFGRGSDGNLAKRQAHLNEPSPDIRLARRGVPQGLAVIVERLLAKNPAFRFVTPGELVTALEPFAAGCTLRGLTGPRESERPESLPSIQLAPPPPPSRMLNGALLACAFLVGAGLSIAFLLTRPAGNGKDIPNALAKKALAIESFEIDYVRNETNDANPARAKDATSRAAFRVTTRVSEPAHLYLIAYLPNGKARLCTPEQEAMNVKRSLTFPHDELMTLKEAGMHAFVLVVARAPLPPFEDWQPGPAVWAKSEAITAGIWKFEGKHTSPLAPTSLAAPTGFVELCMLLGARPGVDAVQGIAIAVPPDPPPSSVEPPLNK